MLTSDPEPDYGVIRDGNANLNGYLLNGSTVGTQKHPQFDARDRVCASHGLLPPAAAPPAAAPGGRSIADRHDRAPRPSPALSG